MGPENKQKYLVLIDEELTRKQESLESIEHGRNTAESAMTSHHDHLRSDLAQDASVVQGIIDSFLKFRTFVEQANPSSIIEDGAEFRINLIEEKEEVEGLFSPVKVSIGNIQIITDQSPIGQAMKGLQVGDVFLYGSRDELKVGTIEDIK